MAGIDYSIAGQTIRPMQIESPVNQMANLYQLQGAQQANQLRGLQMAAAQREADAQNVLSEVYQRSMTPEGELDYNKLINTLAQRGQGASIPGVQKALHEQQKIKFERDKAQTELVDAKLKQSQMLLQQVRTPEEYVAWHEANHKDPILGPTLAARGVTAEASREKIMQALSTPGGFEKLLQQSQLGIEKFAELNKPQIVSPGASVYKGGEFVGTAPEKAPTPPAAQQEYELAKKDGFKGSFFDFKRQLAEASRAQGNAAPVTPVTIVDPKDPTKTVVVDGRTGKVIGQGPKEPGVGIELSAKEKQVREAKFPQATTALKSFESKTDELIRDLEALTKHPGLSGITGVVGGRTPGFTKEARAAEALYNKIVARGGFAELQNLRNSSPTGGALGNVSNQEGQQLKSAFAALDRTQDPKDLIANAQAAIQSLRDAKQRTREAYDLTYEYKSGGAPRAGAAPDPLGIR